MGIYNVLAAENAWFKVVNYEFVRGNAIWRLAFVLIILLVTMATGRIVQYAINNYAIRLQQKKGVSAMTLFLQTLTKPVYVGIFTIGFFLCKTALVFDDDNGIAIWLGQGWVKIARALAAITLAYAIYRLVDVIEYYLNRLVSKTETKLDDMLVPVVRKSLRITISIVAVLLIAENILGADVKSLLLSAGVGGIAVALAAKDTIANFFGSITIFADRPFQIDELVKIGDHYGTVEEVGFRSTRIRTLDGHLVVIPNNTIANTDVENVSKRPFIRRTSNITITYDSGADKTQKAVEIIKEVLAAASELNTDPERKPRVHFSDFNDWSLNIYMTYWVKPAEYWLYHEVNERINFEIMKKFKVENIEFAFPSQTLYVKKDDN